MPAINGVHASLRLSRGQAKAIGELAQSSMHTYLNIEETNLDGVLAARIGAELVLIPPSGQVTELATR